MGSETFPLGSETLPSSASQLSSSRCYILSDKSFVTYFPTNSYILSDESDYILSDESRYPYTYILSAESSEEKLKIKYESNK